MPLLASRCQVAIVQEAVAGTAGTPGNADVYLTTGAPTFELTPTTTDRQAMTASLSPRGSVVGARMAKISFKQYLRGTATAPSGGNPPDFTVPFKGCGLDVAYSGGSPNEIGTWKPSTTLVVDETTGAYCTVAVYRDGKEYKIHGAVGNLKLTFDVGVPVLAEYEFTGIANTPTDVALKSPTYSPVVEPPFQGAALSMIGSFTTAKIKTLTLDLGNQIVMRPYPNTTTGFFTAQIAGRRPVFTIDPEEELAATKNWWLDWLNGTTGAITTGVFPSNGSNYNQFNLTIPKAQYLKGGLSDRDGIGTMPLEGVCVANSDAGEDEFTFVQT